MNSRRVTPGRVVDVQPLLVREQRELEVIGRVQRRAEVDRARRGRPRVLEVDLLPERAVGLDRAKKPRRAELREVAELPAADQRARRCESRSSM